MELIREIYKGVIYDSKLMESVEKKVMKEIEELTLNQKMNMTQEEYETFRGLMFEILAVAQEEAFIVGAHWGIRMLFESFGYTNT